MAESSAENVKDSKCISHMVCKQMYENSATQTIFN